MRIIYPGDLVIDDNIHKIRLICFVVASAIQCSNDMIYIIPLNDHRRIGWDYDLFYRKL